MNFRSTVIIAVLLWGTLAHASTTTVSGTIADTTTQVWSNGTWSAELTTATGSTSGPFFVNNVQLGPSQVVASGVLDASGAFTTVLTSNPSITPSGSLWRFTVCSAASSPCYTISLNIFGTTQNVSGSIVPPPISVPAHNYSQPSAYQDSEISGPILGFNYYNQTTQGLRLCTGVTPCTWVPVGGGGGGGISGSGTANTLAMFTGTTSIGNGPINVFGGVTISTNPFSQPVSLYPCVNSASGTTDNHLVTTDTNGNCINIADGQTNNIIGIVHQGTGGTGGTAQISQIGTEALVLDNQSVIQDCVVAAASSAAGHDVGSQTCPSGVQQVGRVTSLNSGGGTAANVRIFISDIISQSQGQAQVIQINGATISGTLANFNATNPAAQTNNQNLIFQTDNGSPVSNISVQVPLATTAQQGIIKLAQDLGGTYLLPQVIGIKTIPVTFTSPAARDVICFPTSSTLANCPLGVPVRSVSSNSDTILTTDRVSDVRYTGTGATAVNLPQAGSAGFASNFTLVLTNAQGTGTVTVTPTTSTINSNPTLAIPASQYCFIYSDNTNYFANCGSITAGSSPVTSVGLSINGGSSSGIFAVTGSPVTAAGTLNYNLSGTSGGIPYFSSTTVLSSSALLSANTLVKGGGAGTAPLNSSVTDDGTNPTRAPNGANTAAQGNYDEWTVDAGGVTANKLACRSSNNKAQICATSVTTGVLGVALTTQTSGQTVMVCWAAHCNVVPSNNTTAGHWLIPSTTVAGDVDDTGSTVQPTATQTFLAESSVTSPAVVATTILSPDNVGAAGGNGKTTVQVNGAQTLPIANFNSTTPSAPANHLNLPFNSSTSGNTTSVTVDPAISGNTSTLATAGTMSGVANALVCDDGSKNVTTSSCAASASQIPSSIRTRALVFSYGDPGNSSAITSGSTATDYMTVPFACTISAYNIAIDAGTITIKFWKVATGTAIPTSGNSISTSGVSISSGTAIHSTTTSDFTTTSVAANDIMAMNVSTVSTAKFVSATLECDQ
jgi:hypothetical protein